MPVVWLQNKLRIGQIAIWAAAKKPKAALDRGLGLNVERMVADQGALGRGVVLVV